jgi:hypothetical protein
LPHQDRQSSALKFSAGRYRAPPDTADRYEVDIVISKAVLCGSLAVFITASDATLVAGIGTLVGNRYSVLPAALAAAVVAVAFQLVRQRPGPLADAG